MDRVKVEQVVSMIREAATIREEIRTLYEQYHALSETACFAAGLQKGDLKKAVDAIHYLGGGYPSPHSKGRMEAVLDHFGGMFSILEFIGKGHLVRDHLSLNFGITVNIAPDFLIQDRELDPNEKKFLSRTYSSKYFGIDDVSTIRDLVGAVVMECEQLQGEICKLADSIKDEFRKPAKDTLELDDAEFDRLAKVIELTDKGTDRAGTRLIETRRAIDKSIKAFHIGAAVATR